MNEAITLTFNLAINVQTHRYVDHDSLPHKAKNHPVSGLHRDIVIDQHVEYLKNFMIS